MMSQFAISSFASATTLKISEHLVRNEEANILDKQTKLLNNTVSTNHLNLDETKSTVISASDISKRKNHNCPYCDRSFTRPYRLNDHISFSHTDERKYLCVTCSKNFSCKDKLKHHIDVKHDNKKANLKSKSKIKNSEELKCNFPGCSKAFANKYNVKRHIENVHLKLRRKMAKLKKDDDDEYHESNTLDDNGSNILNNSDPLDGSIRSESGMNSMPGETNFRTDESTDNNKNGITINDIKTSNSNDNSNNNDSSNSKNNNNIQNNKSTDDPDSVAVISNGELEKANTKNKIIKMKTYDTNFDEIVNQSDPSKTISLTVKNPVSDVIIPLPVKMEHELTESRFHLKNINQSYLQNQQTETADDGKNSKIYTCAKCPEMFTSSNLLRKHVTEHHEKGFLLYNLW